MRCLLPVCNRLVVNLLGLVPFLSRHWLYSKSYGPGVDRGLSVVTREGRAICLLVRLCLRIVLTVNNYRPESLVPFGSNSVDGVYPVKFQTQSDVSGRNLGSSLMDKVENVDFHVTHPVVSISV